MISRLTVGFWAVSTLGSIVTNLIETWPLVTLEYNESNNLAQDCSNYLFFQRHPVKCAAIILEPPQSFLTTWVNQSFQKVNWCGPANCETVFSITGLLSSVIVFFIVRSQEVVTGKIKHMIRN